MKVEQVLMVVEEEVVVEVGEGGSQEEAVVELEEVVKVEGTVVEVAKMMMTMMIITIFLNIRIGRASDWKTLQSNPFKQAILPGSP